MLEQFEEEFVNKQTLNEDKIFRPINSMSFEEFVEYMGRYGFVLKNGADFDIEKEEFNNLKKLE